MKKILVAALALMVVGYSFWPFTPDTPSSTRETVRPVVSETSKETGIPVRGLVVAAMQQTIVAKQAGTIDKILVQEGREVSSNELLLVSNDPVLEAKYQATALGGLLRTAAANRGFIEGSLAADVAQSIAFEATSSALLLTTASDAREREAQATLKNANELAFVVVPTVLRFVQDNTSSLTVTSQKSYDDALKLLYGYAPQYFLSNNLAVLGKGLDVQKMVTEATTTEDMLKATDSLVLALTNLNRVFETSAGEFYDEDEIPTNDPRFLTYTATRQQLHELVAAVNAAAAHLSQTRDAKALQQVTAAEAAERAIRTELGRRDIAILLNNEAAIASSLQSAEAGVVAAEIDLGMVRAPYAGTVSTVLVETGSFVQRGAPLFTIIGSGAREMSVVVPSELLPMLQVGQSFVNAAGKQWGIVDRFTLRSTGDVLVIVSITDNAIEVGEVLSGTINIGFDLLPNDGQLRVVPRAAITFTPQGPIVQTVKGETHHISIVLDMSDRLLVKTEVPILENLEIKTGIVF